MAVSRLLLLALCVVTCCWSRPTRIYSKGLRTRTLPAGGWTSWFNVDHPGGTGDYETVHSIVRHFGRGCDGIPCRRPMGIKVVSVHGKSPDQEGDRVYISVRRGLMCTDSHQPDHRCADYTVRFYCPGMKALCRSAGETSSTSNHTESSPSEAQNHNNSEHKFLSQKDKTKPHNEVMKVENAKNDTFGEGGGEQEKEKRDNMTKKEKKKKRVELYLGEAVPDSGAAFHKHLLWNDRQTERRRKEQFVYSQWKSRRGLHHQYKLVNW